MHACVLTRQGSVQSSMPSVSPHTHIYTYVPVQSNGPATTQTVASSSTPQKASEVRKPRSHTVATDSPTSPPASAATTSSAESTTASENSVRSSSVSVSLDSGEKSQPLSSSMDGSKPLLPSRPPLLAKPKLTKGPPPPRPKPFVPAGTNQGVSPI